MTYYIFNIMINMSSKQMFLVYFTVLHSNHRRPQFQIWFKGVLSVWTFVVYAHQCLHVLRRW